MLVILSITWIALQVFNFQVTQHGLGYWITGDGAQPIIAMVTMVLVAADIIGYVAFAYVQKPMDGIGILLWLGATLTNAVIVWQTVSRTMAEQTASHNPLLTQSQLLWALPIVVATGVWALRILVVGTLGHGSALLEIELSETQPLTPIKRTDASNT
jgi:hypothetical protein